MRYRNLYTITEGSEAHIRSAAAWPPDRVNSIGRIKIDGSDCWGHNLLLFMNITLSFGSL